MCIIRNMFIKMCINYPETKLPPKKELLIIFVCPPTFLCCRCFSITCLKQTENTIQFIIILSYTSHSQKKQILEIRETLRDLILLILCLWRKYCHEQGLFFLNLRVCIFNTFLAGIQFPEPEKSSLKIAHLILDAHRGRAAASNSLAKRNNHLYLSHLTDNFL